MPDKQPCADCNDTGWYWLDLPIGHPQFGKAQRCHCMASSDATRLAERLNKVSGLDERERAITLADIELDPDRPGTTAMVNAARRFIANPIGFLTLHGTTGNAKTYALKAIVNESLAAGHGATYARLTTLLYYLQQTFQRADDGRLRVKNETFLTRFTELVNVPILCIDEFDPLKVKQSEWVDQIEADLIDIRYEAGLSGRCGTVIAMNGDPELLPPWIYSRLSQWPVLLNNDPDMRPLLKMEQ